MYVGISSRPTTDGSDTNYTTAVVQQVIDFMAQKNLNVYRMCFHIGVNPALRDSCIQYFLDNCGHDLIVNYYHDQFGSAITPAEWQNSTTVGLNIAQTFGGYANRVWLEPANERTNPASEIVSALNSYITTLRNAGWAGKIIFNRWYNQAWATMATIQDPLNEFWHGEHQYFNTETSAWAEQKTQQGLDLGLKILNTEIGAHTLEYPNFTQALVNEVNHMLNWSDTRGVGNCVWFLHGIRNWTANSPTNYNALGLTFPVAPTPPPTFTCGVCGAVFTSQAELDTHTATVHPPIPMPIDVTIQTVWTDGSGSASSIVVQATETLFKWQQTKTTDANGTVVFTVPEPDTYDFQAVNYGISSGWVSVIAPMTVTLNIPKPVEPPPLPPSATVMARVPGIGNRAFVQVYLRRIRDRIFSREQHKRLHPVI